MSNKYSRIITQNVRNGAGQSMLHALNLSKIDLRKPQIGIGTIVFDSNPCNAKLDILSNKIRDTLSPTMYQPFRFSSVGVSDGISMGTDGMKYSLPSRELIANSFESIVNAHYYDGLICVPGCDKNLPGVLMAMCRLDRPSYIIYGGSMPPSRVFGKETDVVTAFESYGKLINNKMSKEEYNYTIENCCNKNGGSCSGLYTANTMASLFEVMGLTLPNSSSYPANSQEKYGECFSAYITMNKCMVLDLTPRKILTELSFKNAIKMLYATGGSTNAIIHLLAIANELDIEFNIDEFNKYTDTPVLLNMKPHGENMMYHLHKVGGMSVFIQYLIENKILDGNQMTITGNTLKENVEEYNKINLNINNNDDLMKLIEKQNVIKTVDEPFSSNNHIKILKGNLAKKGCVSKIYNKKDKYTGEAIVFENEGDMITSLNRNEIKKEHIVIIRGQGETTGCPEMLRPTSALIGYFGKEAPPLLTDGRFSGGSHGVLVAHLDDMFKPNSITGLIKNGDKILIDTVNNSINLEITKRKLKYREKYKKCFKKPTFNNGYLNLYSKYVGDINNGFIME